MKNHVIWVLLNKFNNVQNKMDLNNKMIIQLMKVLFLNSYKRKNKKNKVSFKKLIMIKIKFKLQLNMIFLLNKFIKDIKIFQV